jgi:hypothetical protein
MSEQLKALSWGRRRLASHWHPSQLSIHNL